MKQVLIFLFIPPLFFIQSCQTPEPITEEFIPLFDGESLTGWHTKGNIQTSIEEGVLTVSNDRSGPGGWLLTDNEYENFHLSMEFRCPPPNNSGIAIRYHGPEEGHPAVSGYEINILNTDNTQNPTGSVYSLARAFWSEETDPEGWNTLEVIAEADCLVTKINDVKLLTTHQRRVFKGRIGIQAHPGKVKHAIQLRKVDIKKLSPTEYFSPQIEDYMKNTIKVRSESLFNGQDLSGWEIIGDGTWSIVDGYIRGATGQGDFSFLQAENLYRNFYLKLKFNIEKGHNSGVFIRQDPEADQVNTDTGLEINIYDHNGFTYGWPTGSVVTKARAFIGLVDYNDWNIMEIFAFNNHICTYVNGIKASEYYAGDKFNRNGRICLQVGVQLASEERGGSVVGFKEIEIKDFEEIPFIGF